MKLRRGGGDLSRVDPPRNTILSREVGEAPFARTLKVDRKVLQRRTTVVLCQLTGEEDMTCAVEPRVSRWIIKKYSVLTRSGHHSVHFTPLDVRSETPPFAMASNDSMKQSE